MGNVSPRGFALALAVLAVLWLFLPAGARLPLAVVLILGALAATQAPVHTIQAFTRWLR